MLNFVFHLDEMIEKERKGKRKRKGKMKRNRKRKGKERKGKERKGKERKGKEGFFCPAQWCCSLAIARGEMNRIFPKLKFPISSPHKLVAQAICEISTQTEN
jgi:hypothetical protein